VIIGRQGNRIAMADALDCVWGYAIGLDMTVRGKELQCFRKSIDTYSVLGPWIVSADEIADPNDLNLSIAVNGKERQNSNTKHVVYSVQRLIEYASSMFGVDSRAHSRVPARDACGSDAAPLFCSGFDRGQQAYRTVWVRPTVSHVAAQ